MGPMVDARIDEMRRWMVLGFLRCSGPGVSRSGKVCSVPGRGPRGGNRLCAVHGVEKDCRPPPAVRARTELLGDVASARSILIPIRPLHHSLRRRGAVELLLPG